jgi:two-component system invasion response regulator UvrY
VTTDTDSTVRVMLVDDHAIVRRGFRLLLDACADVEVVAEAGDGEQAIAGYAAAAPDVVVMDLSMPGMGGLEALRRLLLRYPDAKVLVLSAHENAAYARRALKAGASGYLTKRTAPEELIKALPVAASGRLFLDREIAQQMVAGTLQGNPEAIETLSRREFTVFLELARGRSVKQVAQDLSVSAGTVGTHLYNIKQKLGVGNQAEMALIAVRNGLIDP